MMGRRRTAWWFAVAVLAGLLVPTAAPGTLVADLSRHLIAITADFDGTDVLLFGTVEAESDVVIVVQGPQQPIVVRRKDRMLGVWLNAQSVRFDAVPSFYAVAATAPVTTLMTDNVRARHGIGIDTLAFAPAGVDDAARSAAFRAGLVRNKREEGLFAEPEDAVRFVGGGLFRTTLRFPASVRPGRYRVEVFGVRDGRVVAAQQSALIVTKVGVEARLSDFARQDAELYGIGAIIFAVAAGWLAAAAFRRS